MQNIADYFPNLIAGLLLICSELLAGWLIKRIVYQLCVILRIERLLGSFRWGGEFSKADIRHALFRAIGNVTFFIIFLVFLNAALDAMKLTVLSNMIERGVNIIPRLIVALLYSASAGSSHGELHCPSGALSTGRESRGLPWRRGLPKAVILLFFFSMALVELDIARVVVIIGFSVDYHYPCPADHYYCLDRGKGPAEEDRCVPG